MDEINQIAGTGGVTALCNAVGWILKGIPKFPDWAIPIALPIVGMIGIGAIRGWKPENLVEGFLCGFAAVGINQAYRQTKIRE